MRETIAAQMEEQNIEVDGNRLTDVNLLKRHVLKRCIYGVDLNPMAVELAKLSLWLDCFTLGAPLSFLDHHLRCGNSLIGVTVDEVDKIRLAEGQIPLTGTSDWAGLAQAVQSMIDVGGMPDITPRQVSESRNEYRQAVSKLESFKRVLDLHTARWFVEIEKAGKGKKGKTSLFDEMLRSGDLFDWAHERIPTPLGGARDAARIKPIIHQALAAAKGNLFFHWELEFPEVFYGRRPGTQNAVERLDAAGFDAVIGNPPYDELSEHALGRSLDELSFFQDNPRYSWVGKGRLNWYHFFVAQALELTASHGGHGYIVPMSLLGDQFTRPIRTVLLQSGRFTRIEAFPQKDEPRHRIFFDAKLPTCLYTVRRGSDRFVVRVHPANEIDISSPHYECAPEALSRVDSVNLSIPLVSERGWLLLLRFAQDEHLGTLRDYGATPTSGEIVFNQQFRKYLSSSPTDTLILRGSHVQRWEIVDEAKQGEPVYLRKDEYLADARVESKAFHYRKPRVVYQECAAIDNWRRVIAAYLPAGSFCGHKICYFTDYKCSPTALLAVFNSRLIDWIVTAISSNNSLPAYLVGALPFPKFGPIADRDGRELIRLYEAGIASGHSSSESFEAMRGLIADRSRCFPAMHCTLAHLGSRMIDWHREQRAGINRFLGAIAGILAPSGERLSEPPGRGQLKNFLGDYQRNEPQKEFEWVWAVLVRSGVSKLRSIDGSIKNQVQNTYDCYVNELLSTKRKLATTDRLIDRLVYHAYGLNEADMDAVDRERIIPEDTEDTG